MIIYTLQDRISLKIGDLEFKVAPLSAKHKADILGNTRMKSGEMVGNSFEMAALTIKYSIKELKGAKKIDGSDYELKFEDTGVLTEDCVSEILQISNSDKLIQAVVGLMNGIEDPKISGVEVKLPKMQKNVRRQATDSL